MFPNLIFLLSAPTLDSWTNWQTICSRQRCQSRLQGWWLPQAPNIMEKGSRYLFAKVVKTYFLQLLFVLGIKPENYRDLDTQVQSNVKVIDGALVLKNIEKASEGYYLCKSTNGIGRGLSAVIYISVQGMFYHLKNLLSLIYFCSSSIIWNKNQNSNCFERREYRPLMWS